MIARTLPRLAAFALLALSCYPCLAAVPVVTRLEPLGVRSGQETTITLHGARLKDAFDVLSEREGIEILEVKPENNAKVTVRLKVAEGAKNGFYPLVVATKTGLSNLRLLAVGSMPIINELEPNSDFASPQKIENNVTVEGVIQAEDQDFFAVDLKKGQRLTVEIAGVRIASTPRNNFVDPFIAILDAKRFQVATSDDHPLLQQDAVCSFVAPEDGTYTVLVRDSSFGGNGEAHYRVSIGSFPRPMSMFPGGGQAGEMLAAQQLNIDGSITDGEMQLPSMVNGRFPVMTSIEGQHSPSPNYIRISDLPNQMEAEPNENMRKNPTLVQIPAALCGIIQEPDDKDYYAFDVKKGRRYRVQVVARKTLRSPLDSVCYVYNEKFGRVAGNDDSGGPDSYFEFVAAADARYHLGIYDQLRGGSPLHQYRVEIREAKPTVQVGLKELMGREVTMVVPVPRGSQMAFVATVQRKFFDAPVDIEITDLPAGITAKTFQTPKGRPEVPVVLTVEDPQAAHAATLASMKPSSQINESTKIDGNASVRHKLVLGQNRREIWGWDSNKVAVSVADAPPFKITLHQPQVPIVRDGSTSLKVSIERNEEFDGPVYLRTLYNPPGIGINNSRKIDKGKNEVLIPITANGGAQIGTWPIVLLARYDTDNGQTYCSTQAIDLEVQDRLFQFTFNRAASELGKEGEINVGLQFNREFEGTAEVELVGFPKGVSSTAAKQTVTSEMENISFPITVAKDARVGNHKTLNARGTISSERGTIMQTQGTGEIRIDKPLPPKKELTPEEKAAIEKKKAEAAKKAAAAAAKPKKKVLSRLEQLRQQAKEAAAGGG
ncbi:MAG: pre-peptidase C-terminal domain-containing protein [Planctomycetota bacterium]